MKRLIPLFIIFFFTAASFAQVVVIDDFETGVGHFDKHTTFSGSTTGILSTTPTIDSTSGAYMGQKSIKIELIDAPGATNWHVRFLSGTGSPGNNVQVNATGYIGYWLKTDKPYLKTGFSVDDFPTTPTATEKSDSLDVIGDGNWHIYQFDMADSNQWHAWAGTGANGSLTGPITIDAIFFYAAADVTEGDTAVVYLDYVSYNNGGFVPVELVAFDAVTDGNQVDLRWATATETNNKGFEIERKFEDGSFERIAFINGNGTSTNINAYSYSDKVDAVGKYYYRLKQVDFDGTYEYSNTIEANIVAVPGEYTLAQNYPNPFNPTTSIVFNIPEAGNVNLSVFNLLGEKVAELVNTMQEAGTHTINFDASNLASGTYIYTLNVNSTSITKKMVLMK